MSASASSPSWQIRQKTEEWLDLEEGEGSRGAGVAEAEVGRGGEMESGGAEVKGR